MKNSDVMKIFKEIFIHRFYELSKRKYIVSSETLWLVKYGLIWYLNSTLIEISSLLKFSAVD